MCVAPSPESGDEDHEECGAYARLEPDEPDEPDELMLSNVKWAYRFTLAAGVARGVWSYSVLSGYLYVLLDGSNLGVGFAEGAQGIAQAVVSLGAGYLVDAHRRDSVLRFAVFMSFLAVAALTYGVVRESFAVTVGGLALFGGYQGVWTTALETLFADSTQRGHARTRATTNKFALTLLASCAGPLIAVTVFTLAGDDWTLRSLRFAFLVGLGLSLAAAPLLLLPRDLPLQKQSVKDEKTSSCWVPYVVLASDLISGFGSGMTVKFFPLFFKNVVGLSPVTTNLVYVASPIAMIAGARWTTALAKRRGRSQACVASMTVSAVALIGLALLVKIGDGQNHPRWLPRAFKLETIALYLLTCAQHTCRPLKKAVLMDHVPYSARGKWNAVDGVTRFGWSGSAMLGGWLVDNGGYPLTFGITAALQLVAAVLWIPLFAVVDVQEEENPSIQPLLGEDAVVFVSPRRQCSFTDDEEDGDHVSFASEICAM